MSKPVTTLAAALSALATVLTVIYGGSWEITVLLAGLFFLVVAVAGWMNPGKKWRATSLWIGGALLVTALVMHTAPAIYSVAQAHPDRDLGVPPQTPVPGGQGPTMRAPSDVDGFLQIVEKNKPVPGSATYEKDRQLFREIIFELYQCQVSA